MKQYPLFFIPYNNIDMRLCDRLMRCFYPRERFVICRLKGEYMSCLKYNLFYDLVWFGLPDVGKRSGALKVNLGFWLVAGGLASVGVGGHAVETDLVAPGQEVKAQR